MKPDQPSFASPDILRTTICNNKHTFNDEIQFNMLLSITEFRDTGGQKS